MRPQPFLHVLISLRLTTLILQTSGVPTPPYVDFHGFRVPQYCVSHLEAVFNSRKDFVQGFRLGHSFKEHFLKLLGSIMNDIELNFADTVSSERILRWRATVQELINMGFAVEFIPDHLH